MSKTNFSDTTYSLAKALHSIHMAKWYLEDVRIDTHGDVKAIFNNYINKCDFILNNIRDRLKPENKKALQEEMKDTLMLDSILDKLMYIDTKQREFIEDLLQSMIKGEEINIIKS